MAVVVAVVVAVAMAVSCKALAKLGVEGRDSSNEIFCRGQR
jgi:hypothetical protein